MIEAFRMLGWLEGLRLLAPYFFGFLASAIAWFGLHTAAAVNLRNKRIDVISGCNLRYDALAQTKTTIIKSIAEHLNNEKDKKIKISFPESITYEIDLYHRRYWGLKSDQVDYWLAGYIDPETMISWFMSTVDTVHNSVDTVHNSTVIWREHANRGGWESVKDFHETTNQRLYQIAEAILLPEIKVLNPNIQYAYLFHLFRSIELDEKTLINLLKRNSFQRLWMDRFRAALPPKVAAEVLPHELRAIRQRALPKRPSTCRDI